jgi:hypothetical protein
LFCGLTVISSRQIILHKLYTAPCKKYSYHLIFPSYIWFWEEEVWSFSQSESIIDSSSHIAFEEKSYKMLKTLYVVKLCTIQSSVLWYKDWNEASLPMTVGNWREYFTWTLGPRELKETKIIQSFSKRYSYSFVYHNQLSWHYKK